MPDSHSRLAPSSSSRWINCPGSARSDLPDTTNEAAERGTITHSVAEYLLKGGKRLPVKLARAWGAIDAEVRAELQQCIDQYLEFVGGMTGELHHEVKLHHPTITDFGGTIDTLCVTETTLHCVDLKSGIVMVRANNNTQMKSYLLLAARKYPGRKEFYSTIIQSRVGDGLPKTTRYTQDDLDEWELEVAGAATKDDLRAGSWCYYCPLLNTCGVARQHARDMAMESFDDLSICDRELEIIEFYEVIGRMVVKAKEKIFQCLRDGGTVPGWRLGKSLGNRRWKDEGELVSAMARIGVEKGELTETKFKSPAQVEKIDLPIGIKRAALKEIVGGLTERPDNGIVLCETGSSLPSVEIADSFDELPV